MRWLLLLLIPQSLLAQTYAEVRGGLTVGSLSSSRAGLDIEPRASFDALLHHDFSEISVYGSYSRLSYGCAEGFCRGRVIPVTGDHAVLGVGASWRMLWARVGGMLGVVTVQGARDPEIGFGGQGMVGVRFEVGPVQIRPGVTMERMQVRYAGTSEWATALSFDTGVSYRLPF